jgi:hypothetical protein
VSFFLVATFFGEMNLFCGPNNSRSVGMEVREDGENDCSGKEEGRNSRTEDSGPLDCKQELTEEEEEDDDEEYFRKEEVHLSLEEA